MPSQLVSGATVSPFMSNDKGPIVEPSFISVSYRTTAMLPTVQRSPIWTKEAFMIRSSNRWFWITAPAFSAAPCPT